MFLLKQPSAETIQAFLLSQQSSSFSYSEVGASRAGAPVGYNFDHNRARLGSGRQTFEQAAEALRAWRMFPAEWCRVHPANAPLAVGQTVAVVARHLGFWSLNACRIVYLIEEREPLRRFGFAYGTLREHAERGEERFSVEWDEAQGAEGSVWYDVAAFSRPAHILAKASYPLARKLQKQFARDSKQAMVAATRAVP